MIHQGRLTPVRRGGRGRLRRAALASRSSFVRIVQHAGGVSCELVGVVRHRPVRRRVSLRTATALAASGTPIVVRRCSCAARSGAGASTAVKATETAEAH